MNVNLLQLRKTDRGLFDAQAPQSWVAKEQLPDLTGCESYVKLDACTAVDTVKSKSSTKRNDRRQHSGASATFGFCVISQAPVAELHTSGLTAAMEHLACSRETPQSFPIQKACDLALHSRGHAEETR
jgi:hypothetical protein